MNPQDGIVSAQPDGQATVNNDLGDSAPAAITFIPHDGTAMAFDMTGRGQEDTTEGRTMTGDVNMQPQVITPASR